jgi:hypothetical protein
LFVCLFVCLFVLFIWNNPLTLSVSSNMLVSL